MAQGKSNITIVPATDGEVYAVAGDNYRVVISGDQSNGMYSAFDMIVPPGGGPTPHSHPNFMEFFFVIEGELTYKTEAGHAVVGKGGLVHIPFGGDIHCFKNESDSVARVLCVTLPTGMERMFAKIGEAAAIGEFKPVPDMTAERIALLNSVNDEFQQVTYPADYLD